MEQALTERQIQKIHTVLDRGALFGKELYEEGVSLTGEPLTPYEVMHARYIKQLDGHLVSFVVGRVPGIGYVELPTTKWIFDTHELAAAGWVYMETGIAVELDGKPEVTVVIEFAERQVVVLPKINEQDEALVFPLAGFIVPFVFPVSSEHVGLELLTMLGGVDATPNTTTNRTFDSFTGSYIGVGIVAESYQGRGYVPTRKLRMSDVAYVTGVSTSRLSALRNGEIDYGQMSHDSVSRLAAYGSLSSLAGDIYNGLVKYYREVGRDGVGNLRVTLKDGSRYETYGIRSTIDGLLMQVHGQNASPRGEVSLRAFTRRPDTGPRVILRDAIQQITVDYDTVVD